MTTKHFALLRPGAVQLLLQSLTGWYLRKLTAGERGSTMVNQKPPGKAKLRGTPLPSLSSQREGLRYLEICWDMSRYVEMQLVLSRRLLGCPRFAKAGPEKISFNIFPAFVV